MLIKDFEGRDWDIDTTKISVDEWRELKRKYKMTPKKFEEAISEADPDASTFLYWLMLRRAGRTDVTLSDALCPDIIALNAAVGLASEAEAKEHADQVKAEMEAAAEAAARRVPTQLDGPVSPGPSSPPATTPTPLASPAGASTNGSGTATSSGSATSTSSSSPGSVASPNAT